MRFGLWLAIAVMTVVGCSTRIDPYERPVPGGGGSQGGGEGPGGGQQGGGSTVTLTERKDWKVEYQGRTDYQEEDHTVSRVEEFLFTYTGDKLFFLRTFSDADFESFYKSDVQALIEGEVKDLNTIAKNQGIQFEELANLYTKKTKTLYADLLIHGEYNAFLIEVDKSGKATYNYCRAKMEVLEEAASAEYNAWLGVWTVSDGYVGYDIEVSAIENNYLYRVDGWETGPAAGNTQMNEDDDWIQTRFVEDGGAMSFFIQFIASYADYNKDLGDVDYMFVGTYVESGGEKVDDWEGWEVARAVKRLDGSAVLKGGKTEYTVNNEVYTPHYNAMRYSLYSAKVQEWTHFHDAVPSFRDKNDYELPMYRTKASTGTDRTPVHTKNYLRRTQPRTHTLKTR